MNCQIAVAQNIGAAQAKEQQHFGGPNPNAFERRKRRDGFGVVHLAHRIQIELPRSDLFGATFLCTVFVNVMPHDCSPSLVAAHTAEGVTSPKLFPHAIPDSRLSCSRNLLADNLMHDCREQIVSSISSAHNAHCIDRSAELFCLSP